MRPDDPNGIECFEGLYYKGKALLVLGGISARGWKELREEIQPDVIMGANGTCFEIDDLDFHLVVENMHMAAGMAKQGNERFQRIMDMFTIKHNAKVRLISYLSWDLIDDRTNAIKIRRLGELGSNYEEQLKTFSFRKYGEGFLAGPLFNHPGALTRPGIKFRVGTVATQLIHMAGILGVAEVHTIGMDFCFKEDTHHWYKYPPYQPDKFRTNEMFTIYNGIKTQRDWIQGAKWLKSLDFGDLNWIDHSDGLLERL